MRLRQIAADHVFEKLHHTGAVRQRVIDLQIDPVVVVADVEQQVAAVPVKELRARAGVLLMAYRLHVAGFEVVPKQPAAQDIQKMREFEQRLVQRALQNVRLHGFRQRAGKAKYARIPSAAGRRENFPRIIQFKPTTRLVHLARSRPKKN